MFIIPVVRMYQGLVHIFLISDFYDVSQTGFQPCNLLWLTNKSAKARSVFKRSGSFLGLSH